MRDKNFAFFARCIALIFTAVGGGRFSTCDKFAHHLLTNALPKHYICTINRPAFHSVADVRRCGFSTFHISSFQHSSVKSRLCAEIQSITRAISYLRRVVINDYRHILTLYRHNNKQ